MDIEREIRGNRRSGKLTISLLRQLELFRDVAEADLEALARASRWHLYRRHEEIVGPGEEGRPFFVIAAGLVGITAVSPWGEEFIGLLLHADDLFSFADLPPALSESTSAQAMSDLTIVYRLPDKQFKAVKRTSHTMHRLVEEQTNHHLHALSEVLLDFVFYDAQTRFTRILGRLAARNEDHMVWFTHDELGHLTGLNRAMATKFLGQLRDQGLVSYGSHQHGVKIPDPSRLSSKGG